MAITYDNIYAVATSLLSQATGSEEVVTDTGSMVSVANRVLQTSFDQLMNAIAVQVTSRIYAVRPYTSRFRAIMRNDEEYGNIVEKISFMDTPLDENDPMFSRTLLADGETVDHYTIQKDKPVQFNIYDSKYFGKHRTVLREQIKDAFTGPTQLGNFLSATTLHFSNQIEQVEEVLTKAVVLNYMAGLAEYDIADTDNFAVVDLLSEYNTLNGTSITSAQVMNAENAEKFYRFAIQTINNYREWMTDRNYLYHRNVDDIPIARHTPTDYQDLYILSQNMNIAKTQVFPDAFHDDYLKLNNYTSVTYWQTPDLRDTVNVKSKYLNLNDGTVSTSTNGCTFVPFALLCDHDAMGINFKFRDAYSTPLNASGGYYNIWFHSLAQYFNDFTENAVLFTIGKPTANTGGTGDTGV